MPDSGFGSISLPGRAAANKALGRGGQAIQIISLPNNLKNIAKALRLSGEITQVSTNGIVRIETPEGRIDAQVKNPRALQNSLQSGQPIDIEIPPGRPPQQAILKPPTLEISTPQNSGRQPQGITPPSAQNIPATNIPQTNNGTRDNYIKPENNFLSTSRTQPIQTYTVRPVQNIQQAAPLQQDATVRLLAVPPAQAQQIATDFIQTLQTQPAAITRIPFTANLIAENSQTQLLNSALQIKTPPLQNISVPLTPTIQSTPQSILTNAFLQPAVTAQPIINIAPQQTAPSNIVSLQPILNTAAPLQSNALLTPEIAQPLLQNIPLASNNRATPVNTQTSVQTPIQTSLTPAPIIFDPKNPIPIQNTALAKIDIQIVTVQPPQAVITATSLPNSNTTTIHQSTQAIPQSQVIPAATNFTPPLVNTNNNAVTMTAQVTGFTAQGLPLVTLPTAGRVMPQSFVMQFNSSNLQLGSQLQITTQNPVLIQQAQTVQPTNPLLKGFQWPAIQQLHNILLQISPQAASSLLRALPTPTNATQIAPAAMMFIAAVKSGDIAQFLGQNKAEMIQRAGRETILRALSQDTTTSSTRTVEAASSGEWRAVPLPMFWEGEIQQINLYTRREFQEDDKADSDNKGQTRFIFDLELSRMGAMQIDGYLKDQRLDLIIRSQNTFSEPMQQTMRQAYSNALDQTLLNGELNFQGSTKHWVHVLEQEEQLGVNV
jgi:hypothetical protein